MTSVEVAALGLSGSSVGTSADVKPQEQGPSSAAPHSMAVEMEAISSQVPSVKRKRIKLRKGIKLPVYGELTWTQMWQMLKVWLCDPMNAASMVWCILSLIDFIFLASLELGILNGAIQDSTVREDAKEISTQILNALFVLMTAVFHPSFIRHSIFIFRWRPKDITDLRNYYSRGGHRKPNEWIHFLNLNILLHLSCISMYAFALVYWIYPHGERPLAAVYITLVASFVLPFIAGLYYVVCPLQKDYNEVPMETVGNNHSVFIERNLVFVVDGEVLEHAQWKGGLLWDCCSRKRTACLSFFLPCVVFGRTQHRLGLGQKYVQACVFVLVILGPLVFFELAAKFVHDVATHRVISLMGIGLAWTGLTYGAIWRIHMRHKFKLPSSKVCLGNSNLTDCCIWLCCPYCAICQESRTAREYAVVELSEDGQMYITKDEVEPDDDGQTPLFDDDASDAMEPPAPMVAFDREEMVTRNGFVRIERI